MIADAQTPVVEQRESIKIIKNLKGYNWEIRIFPNNQNDKEWLDRMSSLNEEMVERYGNEVD